MGKEENKFNYSKADIIIRALGIKEVSPEEKNLLVNALLMELGLK